MKNLFVINENERKRILNLHENATKRQYLNEQEQLYLKTGEDGGTMVVNSTGKIIRTYVPGKDDNLENYESRFAGYGQKNKPKQNTVTQKNVTKTDCPVGDRKAVMAFQVWLDNTHKGWLPNYPKGLNKDPKKGYGMCGPNTRKAWSQYQTEYKKKPNTPEVKVPEPSQPAQPTTEPGKQSLAAQKSYNTGIGVDNDYTN